MGMKLTLGNVTQFQFIWICHHSDQILIELTQKIVFLLYFFCLVVDLFFAFFFLAFFWLSSFSSFSYLFLSRHRRRSRRRRRVLLVHSCSSAINIRCGNFSLMNEYDQWTNIVDSFSYRLLDLILNFLIYSMHTQTCIPSLHSHLYFNYFRNSFSVTHQYNWNSMSFPLAYHHSPHINKQSIYARW